MGGQAKENGSELQATSDSEFNLKSVDSQEFHSAAASIRQAWQSMPELTPFMDNLMIEETEDGALVRRLRSKRELFDGLKGCITKDNEVESVDPVPLKRLLGAGD